MPPGRICIRITGCFHDKTVFSKENILLDCYWQGNCNNESFHYSVTVKQELSKKAKVSIFKTVFVLSHLLFAVRS